MVGGVVEDSGGPVRVTLTSADVMAFVATGDLETRGVAFARFAGFEQDEQCIWTVPTGARVAWYKDPDGNTPQLTRPAR